MSEPGLPPGEPKKRFTGHLRTYFLTGVVVSAPIVITLWAAYWFVTFFDRWVKPYLPDQYNPDHYLPFTVPGVGLVVALVVITFIGFFAANLVGRTILSLWERALARTPIVRSIYKGTKQLFQTVLSQTGTSFREVALIEWPRPGIWALVFVSREIDGAQIGLEPGRRMYSVYVSTTPNPTGGYVMFLDAKDVHILDMSVEDALKLIISMGLVFPDTPQVPEPKVKELLARRRKA
jgi:uncharacterized membrane protein